MRKNSHSLLINKIMSSKSNSTIIQSKADGQHIGFIVDLANNYRKTYWINELYDCDYSLGFAIAEEVLKGTQLLDDIYRYAQCISDFSKEIVIVNEVLNYIQSLNGNFLLVIGGVEKISNEWNLRTIEFILNKCPYNLKIVIISETFLDMNYNVFKDNAPKLISAEEVEPLDFEKEILEEKFCEEEWSFLYEISLKRYADKEFLTQYYPHGIDLLQELAIRYDSLVMNIRGNVFNINGDLAEFLVKNGKVPVGYNTKKFDESAFAFFCEKGGYTLTRVLKYSVETNQVSYVDRVIKKFFENEKYLFHLFRYADQLSEISLSGLKKEHYYARYFQIIIDIWGNHKFDDAIKKAEAFLAELEPNHPLESKLIMCISLAYRLSGRMFECAERSVGYIEKKIDTVGYDYMLKITDLISVTTFGIKQLKNPSIVKKSKEVEKFLLDERFKDEYWYVGMLQTFVGMNLDFGNYKHATEHLNTIKSIVPFYSVPNNMVSAYFFLGDMESAEKTAKDLIETYEMIGEQSSLVNIYVLLGVIAFYYHKREEALEYLDKAVGLKQDLKRKEHELYFAICFRSMIYAHFEMEDYAKDMMRIYVKRCEVTGSKYKAMVYGAAAYCCFLAGDKEEAVFYAKKSLIDSTTRSFLWLMSTAIIINGLFDNEDMLAVRTYVDKFLQTSKKYGMGMVSVLCTTLVSPILTFARENNIEKEYVDFLDERIRERNDSIVQKSKIKIKMMGLTDVFFESQEIVWKTRKAKELFLLYILRGDEGIDRSELIKSFWGDYVYVSAINNLKTTNNIIRNTLLSYEINFKLNYVNSKYVLEIEKYENDYKMYCRTMDKAGKERDLRKRASLLSNAIALYDDGFASDINVKYFVKLREKLKDELIIALVKLIKDFEKLGENIEAKRYAVFLKKIHAGQEALLNNKKNG